MQGRYSAWWYLAATSAARTGDEMSGPALLLAGLAVTGSTTSASSLLAAITASAAVGGPVLGAVLDRAARPGRLLAGALALYATALLLVLVSLGRVPLGVVLSAAVAAGLLAPAISGGWTSQLPHVVPPGALPRANTLDAMTFDLAGLVGPALAGATAGGLGAPAGVAASIGLVGVALPYAWRLPPGPGVAQSVARTFPLSQMAAAFRATVASRPLARATVSSVISCAGEGMLVVCAPLLGERELGGAARGAVLLSGIAATALAANALLSRRPRLLPPDTIIWCSTLVLAAAMLLAAAARPVLLVAAVLLAGAGQGPQLTALFAVRHREAQLGLHAAIFTTGASLKITGFALGAAIAGPIATRSLPGALLLAAGVQILAASAFAAITVAGPRALGGRPGGVPGVRSRKPGTAQARSAQARAFRTGAR